jgi:hypothetical protein
MENDSPRDEALLASDPSSDIEIVEVEGEVASELTMFADWLTYEVIPGGN